MPASRRTAFEIDVGRRSSERRARLGGQVRSMRQRRRWSQAELGARAGLERNVIGRLERGEGSLDLEAIERVAMALAVPLRVELARDPQEDVADAGHLAMQELVLTLGRSAGFTVTFELPTRPAEPWRSIDVVLGSTARRVAVEVECWNTFGDIGAASRSSARKLVELEQAAVARWGAGARAAMLWVVRDSARNRALVGRYPEVFASRFPASARAWVAALTTGGPVPSEPGMVWCDLRRGRIYGWRRVS